MPRGPSVEAMRRLLPACATFALLVFAAPAAADTFTVTTTTDSTDPCTGTSCPSIRSALFAAQQTDIVGDTIVVPAGDYMLTGGELTVDASSRSSAPAPAQRGSSCRRSSRTASSTSRGVTATISHLTMEGGTAFPATDCFGRQPRQLRRHPDARARPRHERHPPTSGGGYLQRHRHDGHRAQPDRRQRGAPAAAATLAASRTSARPTRPGTSPCAHSTVYNNRANNGGGIFAWDDPAAMTTGHRPGRPLTG